MVSLSIILLNHNTFELTCNCLNSIYHSDLSEIDLEVILVDNGSNEQHGRSFKDLFPQIVYIQTLRNIGFAKANNLALDSATRNYVLLLNSDTLIKDPETFIKCISVLRRFDDKIVLTTRLLTADGQPQIAYGHLPSFPQELAFTLFLHKFLPEKKLNDQLVRFVPNQNRLIEKGYITATFYLFSKELLRLLPGGKLYDNTFLYGEELFWATQWIRAGVKMYYLADVSVIHFIGQSSVRLPNYSTRIRRAYQINGEHQYLHWRFRRRTVLLIYFFRMMRFCLLSPFDKDIRMRLVLLTKVVFK